MADYDTFNNVKVGDKVLLFHPTWNSRKCNVGVVSKVNKTTFQVKESGYTYRKYDGRVFGNMWSSILVEPYDEEKYNRFLEQEKEHDKRKSLISIIKNKTLKDLTTEQLEQIVNIIVPNIEEKENL